MLVDTLGLVLHAIVHPANIQDRDGGIQFLTALGERFPLLESVREVYKGLQSFRNINRMEARNTNAVA